MSQVDWATVKHFKSSEFDSPDEPGSALFRMHREIVGPLDYIRENCGFPLIVTSGFRTLAHNDQVGGVDGSAHTEGYAADLACRTSQQRYKIIYYAMEIGIRRIGIAKTFVHLDTSPFLPAEVTWLY